MAKHTPESGSHADESTKEPAESASRELTEDELSRVAGGLRAADGVSLTAKPAMQLSKIPAPPAPFTPAPYPNDTRD